MKGLNELLAQIQGSKPDVSSDEKLPFSGRIRVRKGKINSSNQDVGYVDSNEQEIDPNHLRSVMLKKIKMQRISCQDKKKALIIMILLCHIRIVEKANFLSALKMY